MGGGEVGGGHGTSHPRGAGVGAPVDRGNGGARHDAWPRRAPAPLGSSRQSHATRVPSRCRRPGGEGGCSFLPQHTFASLGLASASSLVLPVRTLPPPPRPPAAAAWRVPAPPGPAGASARRCCEVLLALSDVGPSGRPCGRALVRHRSCAPHALELEGHSCAADEHAEVLAGPAAALPASTGRHGANGCTRGWTAGTVATRP